MTSIEVYAPQEAAQTIQVHEVESAIRNNAKDALRYREEAKAPGLTDMEILAKLDTADLLAHLALQDKVQEYSGNKKPISR
ncbi:MAG: hypothetical protein JWN12_486 [Candidatus Saccharibacteria bacterium]|nr:hypothetical protein [Candidatus Saccharibacteria bacterium]